MRVGKRKKARTKPVMQYAKMCSTLIHPQKNIALRKIFKYLVKCNKVKTFLAAIASRNGLTIEDFYIKVELTQV